MLKRIFPVLRWLPRYSRADLFGDAIAGFTVAMMVLPQSIAYAVSPSTLYTAVRA